MKPMTITAFRLPDDLRRRLERVARRDRVTLTSVLRRGVELAVEEREKSR
jgi:predicted transcriptional regulator